jgi:alanine racemase
MIMADSNLKTKNLVDWSLEDIEARVTVRQKKKKGGYTGLEMTYQGKSEEYVIPFTDRASVENAITAACVCLVTRMEPEDIKTGLAGLMSVCDEDGNEDGINNCHLIEDYYNSDPGSLKMALDFLRSQNNTRTALILSILYRAAVRKKSFMQKWPS